MDIELILRKNNLSQKTIQHTFQLLNVFGTDSIFGRSEVMKLTNLKSSAASKFISNLLHLNIIIPVNGHGKGKYTFKEFH